MRFRYYDTHWLDEKVGILKGTTFAMTLICTGYSNDAVSAIDYYEDLGYRYANI